MSNREARENMPEVIFGQLFKRMQKSKVWTIKCRLDEQWHFENTSNFDFSITKDGICTCKVIAPTLEDAQTIVAEQLPVEEFLKNDK